MKKRKVVLVTGAASGLGKSIAEVLAIEDYKVYGTFRTSSKVKMDGVTLIRADITSDKDNKTLVKKILDKEKRLDVIVNNAGLTLSGPTLGFTPEQFLDLLQINTIGPFRLIKTACSANKKPSLIINITSLNAFFSLANFGIYAASKHAIEALGIALRYELAPHTQVVSVTPGALQKEGGVKMTHKPVREKFPILNWIIPLTSMNDVAKKVSEIIEMEKVPRRVIIGRDAQIIDKMQRLLPSFVFDKLLFFMSKKK